MAATKEDALLGGDVDADADAPTPTPRCWQRPHGPWSWRVRVTVGVGMVVGLFGLAAALYFLIVWAREPRYPLRTLPGGLVVMGNATVTVREEELLLLGSVRVGENGTLDVANAVLTLDLSGGTNSVGIFVSGGGRLLLDNVLIRQRDRACLISNGQFTDRAVVHMRHVTRQCVWFAVDGAASLTATGGNTGVTLLPSFRGTLALADEDQVWLELYLTAGRTHTVVGVPVAGDSLDSSTGFLASVLATNWPGATVSVRNCRAQQVDLGVSGAVNLTVRDSPRVSLGWSMGLYPGDVGYGTQQRLQGMRAGHVTDRTWTLGPSAVRLVNSGLERLWGSYWGATWLQLDDCDLVDVFVMDGAVLNVTGSTLDQLGLSGSAQATVRSTQLRRRVAGCVSVRDTGRLIVAASPDITHDLVRVTDHGTAVWV
jgi:hypothetical protein